MRGAAVDLDRDDVLGDDVLVDRNLAGHREGRPIDVEQHRTSTRPRDARRARHADHIAGPERSGERLDLNAGDATQHIGENARLHPRDLRAIEVVAVPRGPSPFKPPHRRQAPCLRFHRHSLERYGCQGKNDVQGHRFALPNLDLLQDREVAQQPDLDHVSAGGDTSEDKAPPLVGHHRRPGAGHPDSRVRQRTAVGAHYGAGQCTPSLRRDLKREEQRPVRSGPSHRKATTNP